MNRIEHVGLSKNLPSANGRGAHLRGSTTCRPIGATPYRENGSAIHIWTDNSGSHSWDITTTNNWAAGGADVTYADGKDVLFGDTNPTPGGSAPNGTVIVQSGGVAPSSVTFSNLNVTYTLSSLDSYGIRGSTGVSIQGGGTVIFTGPNMYSGTTSITDGTLQLGNPAAVQNSTVNIGVANGLTFSPGAGSGAGNGTFVLGGLSGTADESLQDTGDGPVTLQVGGNGASTTYSGSLSGSGSLTMAGSGILTLSGLNSYGGGTTIQSGTLRAGASNTLPTAGIVTFAAASGTATLDLNGYGLTVGGLAIAPGASANAAGQIITNSNTSTLGSTATLTYNGGTSSFAGSLQDGGSGNLLALAVSAGSLTLAGANTFSGGATISGGTLVLGSLNAVQNSTVSVGVNDGLQFASGLGMANLSGLAGSGNIALQDNAAMPAPIAINVGSSGAVTTYSGTLSGSGSLNLVGGTLTLSAANSYSGGTTISGGTLRAGTNNALPTAGTVTFGAASSAGTLDLNGYGLTVGGLAVASGATAANQTITNSQAGTATLIFNGTSTFAGTLQDGGSGKALALTVAGGSLTLSGNSGYSGGTQVTAGTLRVANAAGTSATGAGSVAVSSGATFAGNGGTVNPGTISGNVSIADGGTIAPSNGGAAGAGSSAGTLTVGGLTLNSGTSSASQLNYQFDGSNLDSIAVTNTLTLPAGNSGTPAQFNFYEASTTTAYVLPANTYQLISYGSVDNGGTNLAGLSVNPADLGGQLAVFSTNGNYLDVTISSGVVSTSWVSNSNESWGLTPSNWSSGVPNVAGATATFAGTSSPLVGSEVTVSIDGSYTVGVLNFQSTAYSYYLESEGATDGLVLDNSGQGAQVNVSANVTAALLTSLALSDSSDSTMFTIGSGGYLTLAGNPNTANNPGITGITGNSQAIVLTGGGTLELGGASIGGPGSISSYGGGTTVMGGSTLLVDDGSNIGTGGLTITGTGSNATFYATSANPVTIGGSLELDLGGTLNMSSGDGAGTLTVSGQPKLNGGAINVTAGTLAFNNTVAASGTGAVTVTVKQGATLELAGSASALTSATTVNNQASAAGTTGGLQVSGGSQVIGVITGTGTLVNSATTYDGDTVVSGGANLTATQILQNTLTINAGSTVTIAPAVVVAAAQPAAQGSGTDAATLTRSVSEDASSAAASTNSASSDPFTAIQAAIASGSITAASGQRLESRIAAIESLAATDPKLDASLLEDRVLAVIPSSSASSSADASPMADAGASLLALDSDAIGSGSASVAASPTFAPSASFAGSPAAVPEPSTLLLALLAGVGLIVALRRSAP